MAPLIERAKSERFAKIALAARPLLGLIVSAVIAFAAKARAGLPAAAFAAVVTLATLTSIPNDLVQLRAAKASPQRSDRAP